MKFIKHLFSGIVLQGIGLSLFAQTDKPNIVVIMTDQQRADLCGREGFPMDITPFVDEFMGHRTKRILRIERKEYQTY